MKESLKTLMPANLVVLRVLRRRDAVGEETCFCDGARSATTGLGLRMRSGRSDN